MNTDNNTDELARAFTALCKQGQFEEAGRLYWDDEILSLEPMGGEMAEVQGRSVVESKGTWWYANHEIHSMTVEGPYVHGAQFVVRFKMDVTPKGGQRATFDEVGLYTVRNGKIVEERFFYGNDGA